MSDMHPSQRTSAPGQTSAPRWLVRRAHRDVATHQLLAAVGVANHQIDTEADTAIFVIDQAALAEAWEFATATTVDSLNELLGKAAGKPVAEQIVAEMAPELLQATTALYQRFVTRTWTR